MTVQQYLNNITRLFITGQAREHSYRSDLQVLVSTILPDVLVTNEPARVSCGAPDYMLTKKDIPIGYIEAKDIGVDLDSKNLKEQFERYKAGLSNLIITDYLHFNFYKDGEFITDIRIAELVHGEIRPIAENFDQFIHLVENFALTVSQNIKSPSRLATMMAGKARLMADVIEKSLNKDDDDGIRSNLKSQMISFKHMLIHDITNKGFSDIYAQTIAYGMFAARYHDPTLNTFSRIEAAQLIPKSNPFLRKLFQDIAGYDVDVRLVWIVDELVNIFLASDVSKIMKDFGKATKQEDPVIHFYETFLGEYNPALRKSRGVWYTPQPVVSFIVRAVDDVLKDEFNLSKGLADTSKTKITVRVPTHDKRAKSGFTNFEKKVHKVQILDPATGTSTFLAEVIKLIFKKFKGQQGIWSKYVSKDLIPRLNGFELLMASYAMAHLKLDMLLTETGYVPRDDQRLNIYLTNSLEEATRDSSTLFSSLLSDEADQANAVKRDTPVMCVIGNPPYSVSSTNKSEWIENLVSDYKAGLNEKNIQPLSDDYIKFIRFGQHYIDKTGEGVLAYISNNSFIDGIIHRRMRKHLLESFDKIYILDLHGNSKKKETASDGGVDKNVFDIMQGVSINIFIKNKSSKNKLAEVYHSDIYGSRNFKYQSLTESSLKDYNWQKLDCKKPNYFFVPKDYSQYSSYSEGFKIDQLFKIYNTGIETGRDDFFIGWDDESLKNKVEYVFNNRFDAEILGKYKIKDTSSFRFKEKLQNSDFCEKHISKILYRPFDKRSTYYEPNLQRRASYSTIKHLVKKNIGLVSCRQQSTFDFQHIFITDCITERCTVSLQTKETGYVFPLYLYNDSDDSRKHNLDTAIINKISKKINQNFILDGQLKSNNKSEKLGGFSPLDILDYVYGVLHSPSYRDKYKEYLKIDFPRVQYPKNKNEFYRLVEIGKELREIHLLEKPELDNFITQYPIEGDNIITRKLTNNSLGYEKINGVKGKVWINDYQYFDNVPLLAWEFYIGGYQPAQKWLKDRNCRELSYEDIFQYQKIILILMETDRLMKKIDEVLVGVKEDILE